MLIDNKDFVKNVQGASEVLLYNSMLGDKDYPCQFKIIKKGDPKLVLVIGDNSSGKSLFSKMIKSLSIKELNWDMLSTNMTKRTSGGLSDQADDQWYSTGACSVKNVQNVFSRAKEYKKDFSINLDEPTIGLSMRYELAMADFLSQSILDVNNNENYKGVIITTHSTSMIKRMMEKNGADFTVIATGSFGDHNLDHWLNNESSASIEELLSLYSKSSACFKDILNYK